MDDHFGKSTYSIGRLFRDEQRKVVAEVLAPAYQSAENSYRQVYEESYSILNFLDWLRMPPPRHFLDAARYVVDTDLKRLFEAPAMDVDKLESLIGQARKWGLQLDLEAIGFLAAGCVNARMAELQARAEDVDRIENLAQTLARLADLPLGLHIWRGQNVFFEMWSRRASGMKDRASRGDRRAERWIEACQGLGERLQVAVG